MRFWLDMILWYNKSYIRARFLMCNKLLQIGDNLSLEKKEKEIRYWVKIIIIARVLPVILQSTLQDKRSEDNKW